MEKKGGERVYKLRVLEVRIEWKGGERVGGLSVLGGRGIAEGRCTECTRKRVRDERWMARGYVERGY